MGFLYALAFIFLKEGQRIICSATRSDGPVAKRLAQQEFAADHRLPGNASDAKFLASERERWQFLCQGPQGEFHGRSVIT